MRSIQRARPTLLFCVAWLLACPAPPDGPRFLGAGSASPVRGGTLMLSEITKVRGLDPLKAGDEISGVLYEMLFNGLYSYDTEMQVIPDLAERLPDLSADGLTWRVPLRHGVLFHHGREVTANDVVWSLEHMLDPDFNSTGASYYSLIEGAEAYRAKRAKHVSGLRALDRYSVQITLTKPDQSFLHKLAMRFTCVVPKEVVLARGKKFAEHPTGTGPFTLESWERGVRLVLKRNPHYFVKGLPYLDGVVFEEDIKIETASLRFRNGELDVISRMSPPDRALLATPKWRPYRATSPRADVYGIAMNAEMPPFDNVHLRRAVAFAVDRQRWAKARNGTLIPAGQLLPPAVAGHDDNIGNVQHFDLARAKEEMRLAGFPNGIEESFALWGTDSATMRTYAELLQADLAKIGIKIHFKLVNFPVYLEETGKPKRAQILYTGWIMDYPDASSFLSIVSSATKTSQNSSNRAFYSHPWLDKQLDQALVERDPKKRVQMYREANAFVAREAPWAFFANSAATQAWQPYVKNYRLHPMYWIPVNKVWLDLPRKSIAALRNRSDVALRHASLLPWEGAP